MYLLDELRKIKNNKATEEICGNLRDTQIFGSSDPQTCFFKEKKTLLDYCHTNVFTKFRVSVVFRLVWGRGACIEVTRKQQKQKKIRKNFRVNPQNY